MDHIWFASYTLLVPRRRFFPSESCNTYSYIRVNGSRGTSWWSACIMRRKVHKRIIHETFHSIERHSFFASYLGDDATTSDSLVNITDNSLCPFDLYLIACNTVLVVEDTNWNWCETLCTLCECFLTQSKVPYADFQTEHTQLQMERVTSSRKSSFTHKHPVMMHINFAKRLLPKRANYMGWLHECNC